MIRPGDRIRNWREDRGILRFVDENFKATLDKWQEEFLLLFASPKPGDKRIALKACAGPGKTAGLAMAGLWFLGCQGAPGEHPKGLVTSISEKNLSDNLWAEFSKWMERSEYLKTAFEWTSQRIFAKDHPSTWFLAARTWPKTANADEQGKTFSGLHSPYVLALVDESGGIPPTVLRAAEQALARCVFGKIAQAGNPVSRKGMLFEAVSRLAHLWRVITITGDPDDPDAWVNSRRVLEEEGEGPRDWARQQIETYGKDNPWVMVYILGLFPPGDVNALLEYEEVIAAMKKTTYPAEEYEHSQKRIGVDVARFGDDRTVLFPRQGLRAFKPVQLRNARSTTIAARVAMAVDTWGAELILFDDTGGWAHGAIDQLIQAGHAPVPIVYHDKAIKPHYKNRRAEMWMEMARWVKRGGWLPDIPELVSELTEPTYTFNNGQFQIEEKDQIKKRIGKSPDLADALANTFALPEAPASLEQELKDLGYGNLAHKIGRQRGRAVVADDGTGRAVTDSEG